jgi:hypothetical protein
MLQWCVICLPERPIENDKRAREILLDEQKEGIRVSITTPKRLRIRIRALLKLLMLAEIYIGFARTPAAVTETAQQP